MDPIVSPVSIAGMLVSALVSLGLPIFLAIYWHKRTRAKWSAVLVGALTFYIFVYFLEGGLHVLCLGLMGETAISAFINATPWAYVLYAGLAAGVFEETGRLLAFKLVLRKQTRRETGVMYGIGHGGIEAIIVCAVNMVSSLAFALTLNALGAEAMLAQSGGQLAAVQSSIDTLTNTPPGLMFASGLERVSAIFLHIGLSVLVFAAAHRKGKFYLYPVAIALHAAVDCFAVLYSIGVIQSLWCIEAGVALMAALVCCYAYRVYGRDVPPDLPQERQPLDGEPPQKTPAA